MFLGRRRSHSVRYVRKLATLIITVGIIQLTAGPSAIRGNAPATNLVAPDRNREGVGPSRRFQQRNSWAPPPPQGACNMNNAPCTYCGELNHRQGPNSPLWCKHRNERGIPIVRFNKNQMRIRDRQVHLQISKIGLHKLM